MTLPDQICDAHHHLWKSHNYLPADLEADIETVPQVTRTVFVECGAWYRHDGAEHLRAVGETDWVVDNAGAVVEGIVGTADLRTGPLVAETLEAHIEAGQGRFRGIRQRATWDLDPTIKPSWPYSPQDLLGDPWFRRGFEQLSSMDLSFDAWMYFPQLPDLVSLARAYPEATIILNHLGAPITLGPYRDRAETHARWRALLSDVAACPNVYLKVGGIGMPIFGGTWHRQGGDADVGDVVETWGDAVQFSIEAFGPERCMFESNFSVDKVSMSYATLWAAFDEMSAHYSPSERSALFHDTAVRAYRL